MTQAFTGNEAPSSFDRAGDLLQIPANPPVIYTASHTLDVTADLGRLVRMNSASANNVTVAPDGGAPFRNNQIVTIQQMGAGLTTIVSGSGVTVNSLGGVLDFAGQHAVVNLYKIGANEWLAFGGLAAA